MNVWRARLDNSTRKTAQNTKTSAPLRFPYEENDGRNVMANVDTTYAIYFSFSSIVDSTNSYFVVITAEG